MVTTAPVRDTSAVDQIPLQVPSSVPVHVAVILDGNRRWAKRNGVTIADAYHRGAAKVPDLVSWCESAGVEVVTLWALSTDNLGRSRDEIGQLLAIIIERLRRMAAAQRWRIRIIGDLTLLALRDALALRAIEGATIRIRSGPIVNIAVAYGGKQDVLAAIRAVIGECAGTTPPDPDALEQRLARHLATAGQPDPELVIRTSGEQRMSGFMLWQAAQSELYFTSTDWPDFEEAGLRAALDSYAIRARRFGR
jgi:short-chain Z-isoprenyl diphosphate synthase